MNEELFAAVEAGDIEEARRLLDGGADMRAHGKRETKHGPATAKPFVTPLHQAAERGNTEMVRLILGYGVDVDEHDGYGNTPLFYAVWDNDTEMVRLLLDSRADANAKNSAGTTLLSSAAGNGNTEMVALLRQHGCV